MSSRQATSDYARVAGPAVRRVGYAVKSGKLIQTDCADCGGPSKQAHHHNGYDGEHALDVVWLCYPCHMKRHGRRVKHSWERGLRAYMAATRPAGRSGDRYRQYSTASGPRALLAHVERIWGLLVTDEERNAMLALVDRLAKDAA